MTRIIRFSCIALLVFTIFLYSVPILAATAPSGCTRQAGGLFDEVDCNCIDSGNCGAQDLFIVLFNISRWIVGISASLALAFLIIGGGILLLSAGNQQNIDRGKRMIKGAVFGVVIILLSWIIVNLIVIALTDNKTGTIFKNQSWFKVGIESPNRYFRQG